MPSRRHKVHGLVLGLALLCAHCGESEPPATNPTSSGAGGSGGSGPVAPEELYAAVPGQLLVRASMHSPRAGHTATRLGDGRVVVIGGEDLRAGRSMLASVEIYDPGADVWTELTPLPEPRCNHSATLLDDGRILVVGGGLTNAIGSPSGLEVRSEALLFDPATGVWEALGPNVTPRHGHQAARLPSGKILVVGGAGNVSTTHPAMGAGSGESPFGNPLADAEVFDPKTLTFTATGGLAQARTSFTLTALADGRVLVSGGASNEEVVEGESFDTSEIYDEATGTFAPAGVFDGFDRLHAGAARLLDGRVFLFGGKRANVAFLRDSQLFDPVSGSWASDALIAPGRTIPLVVPTDAGGALVIAGYGCTALGCAPMGSVNAWHLDGSVTEGPPLGGARALSTATVLEDGSVLVAGGYDIVASVATVELLTR